MLASGKLLFMFSASFKTAYNELILSTDLGGASIHCTDSFCLWIAEPLGYPWGLNDNKIMEGM